MTIIASIDPLTSPRRIFLHADTVGVDFQPIDAYKEMRSLRAVDESLRPYDVYMTSQGNQSTGPSSSTPRRVKMENTVFIPFNTDHTLTVVGEVITSSGGSGVDAFDRTPLSAGTEFNINYIPPQVEILTVNSGSGVTPSDIISIAAEVRTNLTPELQDITENNTALINIEPKVSNIPQDVWDHPKDNAGTVGSIGEYITKKLVSLKEWYSR